MIESKHAGFVKVAQKSQVQVAPPPFTRRCRLTGTASFKSSDAVNDGKQGAESQAQVRLCRAALTGAERMARPHFFGSASVIFLDRTSDSTKLLESRSGFAQRPKILELMGEERAL